MGEGEGMELVNGDKNCNKFEEFNSLKRVQIEGCILVH